MIFLSLSLSPAPSLHTQALDDDETFFSAAVEETDGGGGSQALPVESDFMLAYATVPGTLINSQYFHTMCYNRLMIPDLINCNCHVDNAT